jgi:hypothetical protein
MAGSLAVGRLRIAVDRSSVAPMRLRGAVQTSSTVVAVQRWQSPRPAA